MIFEKIAREMKFEQTIIQSAHNNDWIKGGLRIPFERSLRRYDENANRLGYSQMKDKNWYKIAA